MRTETCVASFLKKHDSIPMVTDSHWSTVPTYHSMDGANDGQLLWLVSFDIIIQSDQVKTGLAVPLRCVSLSWYGELCLMG